MLNLEQNGDTAKEKIHFLNMIDQWMIEACIMLFDGHHGLREFKFGDIETMRMRFLMSIGLIFFRFKNCPLCDRKNIMADFKGFHQNAV